MLALILIASMLLSCASAVSAQTLATPRQDGPAREPDATMLRYPDVSSTHIVFVYAGDLWIVSREGGDAKRLTTGVGIETNPVFSPDGSMIAFTGEYDGNTDVYVLPAAGGVPKRLTYHPGADLVSGWTNDGKRVLFASGRNSYSGFPRLFTVGRTPP